MDFMVRELVRLQDQVERDSTPPFEELNFKRTLLDFVHAEDRSAAA